MKKIEKKEVIRFFKYLMFTCSAGLIQLGSTTLLNEFTPLNGDYYWAAYLIGLVLSVIWNFTFNRKFTFKSANNIPIAMLKVFGYYCVFTPCSTLWSNALTGIGWNEYIVLAGTMIINFATEYLFCRFVVFGKSIDTMKSKKSKKFDTDKQNNQNVEVNQNTESVENNENNENLNSSPEIITQEEN